MTVPGRNRWRRPELFPEVIVPGSTEAFEIERIFAAEKERMVKEQLAKEIVLSVPVFGLLSACAHIHNLQKSAMVDWLLSIAPQLVVMIVVPLVSLLVFRAHLQWYEQRTREAFQGAAGSVVPGYAAVLTLINFIGTIVQFVVLIPSFPLFNVFDASFRLNMIAIAALDGFLVAPSLVYCCIPSGPLRDVWGLTIIARVCLVVNAGFLPIDWKASLHDAAQAVLVSVLSMLFLFLRRTYWLRHGSHVVQEPSFSSSSGSERAPPILRYAGSDSDETRVPSLSSGSESMSSV
jgi:hypothetical protein